MTSSFTVCRLKPLVMKTQNAVQAFEALDTDAKLAWFYLAYEKWHLDHPMLPLLLPILASYC